MYQSPSFIIGLSLLHGESLIVVILSTCSVLMFVNTWLLTQLPIWKEATQGSRLLSIICLRYRDKKYYPFANFMGLKQGGLATAFDLAAFWLSMIAPVKKSVNHSRTVASMRETGWEQQQHQEVRLRSDSTVWSEFAFGPVGHCFLCCNQFLSAVMWSLRFPFVSSCVCHYMRAV